MRGMGDIAEDIASDQAAFDAMMAQWGETGSVLPSTGTVGTTPTSSGDWTQQQRATFGLQAAIGGIGAISNAVSQGFQTAIQYDTAQARLEQQSQMFEAQLAMMQQQMQQAAAGSYEQQQLQMLLQQMQGARTPQEQQAALLQAQLYMRRPVWPWVLGGVVALAAVGGIIYLVAR